MTIETVSGGVTTKGAGSLDISIFYRRDAKSIEQPLHIAEKDRTAEIKNLNSLTIVPSGSRHTSKFWSTKRNNYPEGSFLKLNIIKRGTTALSFGVTNLMLRVRKTAPLTRVSIDLPTDVHSSMSVAHIEGRFDVLTTKQVQELGLFKSGSGTSDLSNYDDDSDDYRISILEAELAPAKKVEAKIVSTPSDKGGKVILRQRRVRHIRT